MLRFQWMILLAFFVWSCAWLHGPAFQASAHDIQADALTRSKAASSQHPVPRSASRPVETQASASSPPQADSKQATDPHSPENKTGASPSLSQTTNVLVLGLDKKPGEVGLGRPDTIVVAALSSSKPQLGLLSVPRDLYVEIEGHGLDRINATYAVALKQRIDPAELTQRVIEDTLSLRIHHTLTVDLGAFEELVDSVGGVEVYVPCPISDNFIDPRTDTGRRLLNIDAGLVHMDGITAGLYARSRHGRSDLSRARRQQAILLGMKRRLLSGRGFLHINRLLSTLSEYVQSDMRRADMLTLGAQAAQLEAENIHGLVLGYREAAPTTLEDGKQVLVPNPAAIQQSLSRLFSAPAPGAEPHGARCAPKDAALLPTFPSR